MSDPYPQLPGQHIDIKLKCPSCGWNFALGLRMMATIQIEGEEDDEKGTTCCSKCLADIEFKLDGTAVKLLTPEDIAAMSPARRSIIIRGHILAWLSQRCGATLQ